MTNIHDNETGDNRETHDGTGIYEMTGSPDMAGIPGTKHDINDDDCCASQKDGGRRSRHSDKMKSNLSSRLNRIEGQIRGVKGLIERDAYCDDVLNQIAAIQAALNGVGKLLLEGHMKSCVIERIQSGDHEVIDELLITVKKLMK